MKTILVLFDTLNRRMLEPYGCDWTITPNFTRLAKRTVTFENSYVGSLPCMPARRELHTGRYNFLHRSWGPLEPFDDSLPEILKEKQIYSHLISDHQHYWEDGGCNYHNRYNTWEIVRGQEGDCWKASVSEPEIPEHYGRMWRQDIINRKQIKTDEDFPLSKVFNLGMEFLEENKDSDNWFLHLESFDPHEPFFAAQQFRDLYPDDYAGPMFEWPEYRKVEEPPEAVEHCRKRYASLLSACDHQLGRILDFMDSNNMWEDTALIVCTDHGFLLGEHDSWAKCVHPFYSEVAHTPLFVWDPRLAVSGERRKSLVQTIDIAPTVLDIFGIEATKDMQGKSLKSVIKDDTPIRECALFGLHGGQVNITDGRYVYMRDYEGDDNGPLYNYTLMPTHMRRMFTLEEMKTMESHPGFTFTKGVPVMRIDCLSETGGGDTLQLERFGTRLYDLQTDPEQKNSIQDAEIEGEFIQKLIKLMKESDAPPEQFKRLGLT
ncbi:MAG: sulfatase [Defluviitaleaceae bacterium]|nr:sulfatase [Defluviitaleaceae bacterium]